jgi:UDP-glucose 4-epimerase
MARRHDPYAKDAVMRYTWRTSMTTLITGGMGFIGLHTARAFLDAGEDVVITYFQTWREPGFIKDEYHRRVQIEKVDVTDREGLMALGKKHKIDRIAHLAVPGLGALGPVDDLRTNITGLTHVLEAALAWGSKRLTLASSVAVYAGLPAGPFLEDALLPIASGNPTETFKKAWEILALHFASRTGLEIISMRIGGIWGPLYHSMANLPSRLTHAAVKGTDPDLASTRGGVPFAEDSGDMCYVKDCAQGIQFLTLAEKLPHNIYNVGSGRATTNGELLAAVKQAVPACILEIKEGRSPRWRQDVYMDISRIKADTGYEPRYTVETGVRDYVAWLQAGNSQ